MPRHPLHEFGDHMMNSDGPLECGETWSADHGWRTYLRAGSKAIVMPPRAMRKLGEKYRDHPEATDDVRKLGTTMVECSNAAKNKNERHVIPADPALFALPAGARSLH